MGNAESAVAQKRLARFRPAERPAIEGVFDRLHAGAGESRRPTAGGVLTLHALQAAVGDLLSESLLRRFFGCMCRIGSGTPPPAAPSPGVSREQLVVFLADTLRGTAEERAPLVLAMTQQGAADVSGQQVSEFLQDLISGVLRLMAIGGRLQGWEPNRMSPEGRGVQLLAEQMCSELKASDSGRCDVSCLEDWIFRVPQVSLYLEMLVAESLGVALSGRTDRNLLPSCQGTPWKELRSLLDLPTVLFLAPLLPDRLSAPWRLVFSTQLHGESFTRMATALTSHGPNLLVVKDTQGHVFGGFASHTWEVKPQFQGDSRCFLFTIAPRLRVFTATSYNQHFMYLNQNQQTMPNGLGMGGQHHYFGLWLDSNFGRGHSRARPKCTTYGSPQLSADEDFAVDCVEVWAVGKLPEPEEGDDVKAKKSILDADPEAEAMLEMAGRSLHSQGLREPEEEP
ncbi:MTOR-associated protein MEAK7 [Neosynchiropus ocellatus]